MALSCGALLAYALSKQRRKVLMEVSTETSQGEIRELNTTVRQSQSVTKTATEIGSSCEKSGTAGDKGKISLSLSTSRDVEVCEIMDEVLVNTFDSVVTLSKIAEQIAQERPSEAAEVSAQIRKQRIVHDYPHIIVSKVFLRCENTVCQRYNIPLQDYYDIVRSRELAKDEYVNLQNLRREVVRRLRTIEEVIGKAVAGKYPTVRFEFGAELTKERTIQAFKLIISSHTYVYYKAVQSYVAERGEIEQGEAWTLLEGLVETKKIRRNAILQRMRVHKGRGEDYRVLLEKAYYTYSGEDKEFAAKMESIIQFQAGLKRLIASAVTLPALERDPFKMSEEEFAAFYDQLLKEYTIITRQDSMSESIEEASKQSQSKETTKPAHVGVSYTPINHRTGMSVDRSRGGEKYFTIQKRVRELQSPVVAAFGDDNTQDRDEINRLLRQLS